ncbi:hypothetical protein [Thermaurantiacus sp.]
MIGRVVTMLAGRSLARNVGGAAAGPVGALVGAALPAALPWVARRLGPLGMVAAAVGSYVVARALAGKAEASGAPEVAPPGRPRA